MDCLQGYVKTTYDVLIKKLGKPSFIREGTYSNPKQNDADGKISVEWEFDKFYVYDWKLNETPKDIYLWHIGGNSKKALLDFESFTNLKTIIDPINQS